MSGTKARVRRIFENIPNGVDTIILANDVEPNLDVNFFYAIGASSGLFEGCAVVLHRDGGSDLFSSILEETSARETDAALHLFARRTEKEEMLRKELKGVKRLGVSGSGLTLRVLDDIKRVSGAEVVDVWKAFEAARAIKDKEELESLREACRIASAVGEELPDLLERDMAEYELAAEVNYRMQKKGASAPAFSTDASFGPNTAEPHHSPGARKLTKGDCVLVDFGASVRRYGSDITRTMFFGSVSPKMKRMYGTVRRAQLAAIGAMRDGAVAKDVDAAARSIIDASEFKGLFNHSLGHTIGLAVHDGIRASMESDAILKQNMVITAEPGAYIRGEGGVRIEDDVLITKKGAEMLTSGSTELRVV
ncbi:MAG: M24 family metallopeptidase [Methanomassiliicoccales archaeon]|nr:M24 family metallopeptidase [Methanomassiliicoccales archaeon]